MAEYSLTLQAQIEEASRMIGRLKLELANALTREAKWQDRAMDAERRNETLERRTS